MSRHRFVKSLVEDDYYDDYYDEDDYYEEEDYTEEANKKDVEYNQGYNADTGNKSTSATVATRIYNPSQPPHKQQIPISQPTSKTTPGIVKPPPGWGKPAPPKASNTPSSTSAKSGVSAPPVGWGKPSTSATPTKSASAGGLSKPPPGWGKPTATATNNDDNNRNSGIMKPPPGWGKPSDGPKSKDANAETTPGNKKPSNNANMSKKEQQSATKWQRPVPDVLTKDKTSQISMAVLGHVDAGKSTLMGQLLIQVGQVSKRAATKQNNLAWLLDEDESERQHGVTMQIGTKAFATPNHDIVILDSPGHADYIPVMITGAAQADVAILVVPATRGEFEAAFERGQTKEHILLARGLGVTQVIVAVNKLDVIGWDQTRFQQIRAEVTKYLLQQQFVQKRIRFVPLSGLTGENVKAVSPSAAELLKSWYKGPTLLEAIDRFQPANRHVDKPFRFVATDVSAEGKGVIVRGRVIQGFCQTGDRCSLLPIGDLVTISKLDHLQPPSGENSIDRLSIAQAGDTVELVITGVDVLRLGVGSLLVPSDPKFHPPISKRARAKVVIRDSLKVPIIRGSQVLFHMHSLNIPAVLSNLISIVGKNAEDDEKPRKPRSLPSGCAATVEFTLQQEAICMEAFADCRALGRFVLRRGGDTVAVGIIEEVLV